MLGCLSTANAVQLSRPGECDRPARTNIIEVGLPLRVITVKVCSQRRRSGHPVAARSPSGFNLLPATAGTTMIMKHIAIFDNMLPAQ